jgi:hypothetical protein
VLFVTAVFLTKKVMKLLRQDRAASEMDPSPCKEAELLEKIQKI